MPVTRTQYANYESQIYAYLTQTLGVNVAVACGILANIEKESSFNPNASGDNGTSYGLCQWHKSRFNRLKDYTGSSYTTVAGQMKYLNHELKTYYGRLWNNLKVIANTAQGAYDTASMFCIEFEVPADKYTRAKERGTLARNTYWTYYSTNPSEVATPVPNIGNQIVQIALGQLNKTYKKGADGYNSSGFFDDAGLIYYAYKEAGIELPVTTSKGYFTKYTGEGKHVTIDEVAAGDLVFYKKEDNSYVGAIADGEGNVIIANEEIGKVEQKELSATDSPTIVRTLSDAQTSTTLPPGIPGEEILAYAHLTATSPYAKSIEENLNAVADTNYKYGYLLDLTHEGAFVFYIPEFTEQAGASWESVNIRGRSVTVQSYQNTASRTITVSLELYAGEGVYKAATEGEDTVSKLHKDLSFVKSLEYPDYSNAIVRPPSSVQLILGPTINIEGVVSGVTVEHLKPFDTYNRAMYVKLSFTVTQTAVNPPDYRDIRDGQYTLPNTGDIDSLLAQGTTPAADTNTPASYIDPETIGFGGASSSDHIGLPSGSGYIGTPGRNGYAEEVGGIGTPVPTGNIGLPTEMP